MDVFFITSNTGKIFSLQKNFELVGRKDINIVGKDLEIVEIQAQTVAEVSKDKAIKAFEILKSPLIVEDGGFVIDALNGFPGVYTKYVLDTIGVDGILKLLEGNENRVARFLSITTFIDEKGQVHQFERDAIDTDIALEKIDKISPYAWSELWKVLYIREFKKCLCEFSQEELEQYYELMGKKNSLRKFVDWFIERY